MESVHYTRSKAHRTSLVADTQSDVDPDGVALESDISGPVRLSVTAAEKLESLPQELAATPSAPVQGADGGIGSESVLQAGASLSAPGGHFDPPTRVDTQQYKQKPNLVLSDSGVPGGPLPDAAAVGEHPTLSAVQRPSTPRPWATSRDFAPFNLRNLTLNQPQAKPPNLTLGGCLDEANSRNRTSQNLKLVPIQLTTVSVTVIRTVY